MASDTTPVSPEVLSETHQVFGVEGEEKGEEEEGDESKGEKLEDSDKKVDQDEKGEDKEQETEEARKLRIATRPGSPTKEEVEEHSVTHWPMRTWCEQRVKGEGRIHATCAGH